MRAKKLKIGSRGTGRDFYMPIEFTTETAGILARKGAGKTYTAQVIAEELLENDQQVVAIDPLNVWWGLRSHYKIVIFGGDRSDMPLEAHMGHVIADLVADNPDLSCVLSLRHLRKNKMRQFVTDFAETLFHRKATRSTPMHLFVDEADLFAPQRVYKGGERMLGAMEDLVRRGRTAGIGCTMITQRPQSLNKDVLTQIEILVVGQITGPQDKKAIREWIEQNADIQEQGMFLTSLAKLKTGQMWFWSPSFLGVLERIEVYKKRTTDSSATPKAGKRTKVRMKAQPIDLKAIKSKLAEVVAEVESNDPKVLKAEITRLKQELSAKVPAAIDYLKPKVTKVIKEKVAKAIGRRDKEWRKAVTSFVTDLENTTVIGLVEKLDGFDIDELNPKIEYEDPTRDIKYGDPVEVRLVPVEPIEQPTSSKMRLPLPTSNIAKLPKVEFGVLTVLALRGRPCSRKLVALQAGYSPTSGGLAGALASLRKKEFINGSGDQIRITSAGLSVLGPVDSSQLKKADYWIDKLKTKAEKKVFQSILGSHPKSISKEEVAELTGYSVTSGGLAGAFAKLRGLELIIGNGDAMTVSPEIL